MAFQILIYPSVCKKLEKMDKTLREHYFKKLQKLKRDDIRFRHLKHGLPYFADETGGNRIVFEENKTNNTRCVLFIGDHDEYQKWYMSI